MNQNEGRFEPSLGKLGLKVPLVHNTDEFDTSATMAEPEKCSVGGVCMEKV